LITYSLNISKQPKNSREATEDNRILDFRLGGDLEKNQHITPSIQVVNPQSKIQNPKSKIGGPSMPGGSG
jgi:hypothetical protein